MLRLFSAGIASTIGRKLAIFWLNRHFPDVQHCSVFALYGPPSIIERTKNAINIVAEHDSYLLDPSRYSRRIVLGFGADKVTSSGQGGVLILTPEINSAAFDHLVSLVIYLAIRELARRRYVEGKEKRSLHEVAFSGTRDWLDEHGIERMGIDALFKD